MGLFSNIKKSKYTGDAEAEAADAWLMGLEDAADGPLDDFDSSLRTTLTPPPPESDPSLDHFDDGEPSTWHMPDLSGIVPPPPSADQTPLSPAEFWPAPTPTPEPFDPDVFEAPRGFIAPDDFGPADTAEETPSFNFMGAFPDSPSFPAGDGLIPNSPSFPAGNGATGPIGDGLIEVPSGDRLIEVPSGDRAEQLLATLGLGPHAGWPEIAQAHHALVAGHTHPAGGPAPVAVREANLSYAGLRLLAGRRD